MSRLARARAAGLTVSVSGGRLALEGPEDQEALAKDLLAAETEVLAELEAEARYKAALRAAVPISAEWFRARTAEDLLAMLEDGTPPARCFACSSTCWWRLAGLARAHWICGICHPPLVPAERVEWFDGGQA